MFWMNVRLRFLFLGCLLFVFPIYVVDAQVVSRQKQGQMRELNALANSQTREASLRMLAIWDSLNTNHHNLIYHLVPISFTEKSHEKNIRTCLIGNHGPDGFFGDGAVIWFTDSGVDNRGVLYWRKNHAAGL